MGSWVDLLDLLAYLALVRRFSLPCLYLKFGHAWAQVLLHTHVFFLGK